MAKENKRMEAKQIYRQLSSWACVCGILSVLFYLLHDVIGAMHYPGYQWMRQAVSDLTAADAPSFIIASGLSSIHGIFSGITCAFLCVMAKKAGATDRITLTGGCAKNAGLKKAIQQVLNLKVIDLPVDPQLIGAIGAAEFARRKAS